MLKINRICLFEEREVLVNPLSKFVKLCQLVLPSRAWQHNLILMLIPPFDYGKQFFITFKTKNRACYSFFFETKSKLH